MASRLLVPAGVGEVHLVDDTGGDEPEVREAPVTRQAAADAQSREVEDLVDHRRDALGARHHALGRHGAARLELTEVEPHGLRAEILIDVPASSPTRRLS